MPACGITLIMFLIITMFWDTGCYKSHLTAVKGIFRYLKGTTNLGLLYRKSLDYKLIGFCDADFAGDRIERKSTSGNCQFLGENMIS